MVRTIGHKTKTYHPYFKIWVNTGSIISSSYKNYDTTNMENLITQKSIDSLKLNPIPFYVKPEIPVIESAQELCRKLEGTTFGR